jgi:hypothetical protein
MFPLYNIGKTYGDAPAVLNFIGGAPHGAAVYSGVITADGEYRFTSNIGLFGEAGYDLADGASNNFMQTNFRPQIRLSKQK